MEEQWAACECFFIGLLEKTTKEWVGQVKVGSADWDSPGFMIGYVADMYHEGKGQVSKAAQRVLKMLFEDLGAHRVWGECDKNNLRSVRLLERRSFRREDPFLEDKQNPDGSMHGGAHYTMLPREHFHR